MDRKRVDIRYKILRRREHNSTKGLPALKRWISNKPLVKGMKRGGSSPSKERREAQGRAE